MTLTEQALAISGGCTMQSFINTSLCTFSQLGVFT